MKRITDTLPDSRGARHLIAFLPGAWDVAEDFQRFGFVSQVRGRGLAADIVAVDSHVGYFNNGSIAERVRDEVVVPAREAGYRSIWLVGISLGGLGSMLYASRHPGVDGIVALAPYLATRDVIAEVRHAGGLAAWAQTSEPAAGDWERRLLKWLPRLSRQAPPPPPPPPPAPPPPAPPPPRHCRRPHYRRPHGRHGRRHGSERGRQCDRPSPPGRRRSPRSAVTARTDPRLRSAGPVRRFAVAAGTGARSRTGRHDRRRP